MELGLCSAELVDTDVHVQNKSELQCFAEFDRGMWSEVLNYV